MKKFIIDENMKVYDTELYGLSNTTQARKEVIIYRNGDYYIQRQEAGKPVKNIRMKVIFEADEMSELYVLEERLRDNITAVLSKRCTYVRNKMMREASGQVEAERSIR